MRVWVRYRPRRSPGTRRPARVASPQRQKRCHGSHAAKSACPAHAGCCAGRRASRPSERGVQARHGSSMRKNDAGQLNRNSAELALGVFEMHENASRTNSAFVSISMHASINLEARACVGISVDVNKHACLLQTVKRAQAQ
eukprot:1432243-Pleurochrysis_carterae.AAC.2